MPGESYYETTYTVGLTNAENEVVVEEAADTGLPAVWSTLFIVTTGVGIAWVKMNGSLRREPMQLLYRETWRRIKSMKERPFIHFVSYRQKVFLL